MFKIYSILAAAALIAGALVVAPSLTPVSASTRGDSVSTHTQTTSSAKGDRLDVEARVACRQQSWPYVDRSCVRDPRTESGMARKVRVVSADRR